MISPKHAPDGKTKFLLVVGILAILAALLFFRLAEFGLNDEGEKLRSWVQSFGPLSPIVFIVLYMAQVLFAPIPGGIVTVLGGYLFGPLLGTVYSLIGLGLGATLAVKSARRLGRPLIERLVGVETISSWERQLHFSSPVTWVLIFLLPFPDAVLYVAGLVHLPLRWLVIGIVIGRTPSIVASNWLGAQALTMDPPVYFGLLALFSVIWIIVYRYERQLRLILLLVLRQIKRRHLNRLLSE